VSRRPVRKSPLRLLSLDERITPDASPAIRQTYVFDGPSYTSNPPPTAAPAVAASPGIAVGPNHTVTITNNQIQWRTIPNGDTTSTNLAAFFNLSLTGSPIVWSGAEAIYDPVGQRFVVAAAVRSEGSGQAVVFLAASDDSNPANGGWIFRSFNANLGSIGGTNYAADLGLAADEQAVYITTSHYLAATDGYQDARVSIVDSARWYANQSSDPVTFDPSPAGEQAAYRALQPAQIYGTPPTGTTGTFFVSYSGVSGGNDTARVVRVTNPLTAPAFPSATVDLGDIDQGGALPDAPQNTTPALSTGNREVGNAVWRNDQLYFAATINPVAGPDAGQATAHWFHVDTTTNTPVDGGNLSGGTATTHTFFPTVTVDLDGNLAITYSGSRSTDTVKGYYAARLATDPAGTMRDEVEINPAPTPEGGYVNLDGTTNLWGPSTSIALDPAGRGFYAFDAFATTPATGSGDNLGRWATKGVAFSFNWAPEIIPSFSDVVNAVEDDSPEVITVRGGFTDYEDITLANPDLLLDFEVFNNTNPTLVTVEQFDPTDPARVRLTYAPNGSGVGTFSVRATDSGGAEVVRIFTVVVQPQPDAPVGVADSYTVAEDTILDVAAPQGVLANDFDPDENETDNLKVQPGTFTQPANGTLELLENGGFIYTPDPDYFGPDSFTYRAVDPTGRATPPITVSLTVTAVNDAPNAEDDPATGTYTTPEDTDLVVSAAQGVLANDSDVDSPTFTAHLANQGTKGTVTLDPNGSFTYVPLPNAFGTDTFTYVARDGSGADSAPATVTIQITPVDDAPVANADSYSTPEDETLSVAAPGVLGNDNEFDGQPLTLTKLTDPLHGELTLNQNGSVTYVPDPEFFGTDSFTYTVSDGTTSSAPATVNITVDPVNDAPVAAADSYKTPEDVTLNVAAPGVLGNDTDADGTTPTVVLVSGPAHATAFTLNADGSFTYSPVANYFGPDSFTYKLTDGTADSNTVTVSLTVNSVQDAPVATDDGPVAVAGKPVKINVLANDSDVDRDRLSVQNFTAPTKGTVTRSGSQLLYTPRAGATGADSFTYRVSDGKGNTDTATVSLTLADTVAPKVQAVRVFYGPAASVDLKTLTRSVLSWENITRVDIVFTEAVDVEAGDLTLAALGGGTVTTNFSFNAATRTGTWTFGALAKGRYNLRLTGTVQDLAGNALGADWARSFAVLPGDFDGNGVVNATDVTGVKGQKGKANASADINGDGVVNDADTARVTANLGSRL
jgi:VCBS repeat-containing protein